MKQVKSNSLFYNEVAPLKLNKDVHASSLPRTGIELLFWTENDSHRAVACRVSKRHDLSGLTIISA